MLRRVSVKYHGKASHASAYPWEGVNALDAAVLAYNNVSVLRQQLKPEWRLHGEEQTEAVTALVDIQSLFLTLEAAADKDNPFTFQATVDEKSLMCSEK